MRKITLFVPEPEKIEINGEIYQILLSDVEILNRGAALQSKYTSLSENNPQHIITAVNEVISFIDEILGNGAVKKISGGKPVGMIAAIGWLKIICAEIGKANDDYIDGRYGNE